MPDDQKAKFQRAALGLVCDQSEGAFEEKLRQIAKTKPKPSQAAKVKNDKAPE